MKRFTLTAILFAAVATAVFAQPRPRLNNDGPPPPPPRPNAEMLATFLNLTDAQKTQWDAATSAFESAVAPLHEKIKSADDQLRELMDAKSNDANAIGTLMIAIRDTHDQIRTQHDALDTKLAGTLTAEQKVKFEAFRVARPPHPDGPPPRR